MRTKECNNCGVKKCKKHHSVSISCHNFQPIKSSYMLAELALAHPQSLHDSLSKISFEVNLDFYLKR